MARTLAGVPQTGRPITPISIPAVRSTDPKGAVDELRRSTEVILNRQVQQANRSSHRYAKDVDAGGFKLQNLGNPVGSKDAVPLDFLKRALKNLQINFNGGGGPAGAGGHGFAHWGLAIGFPAALGTDLSAHNIVGVAGAFEFAYINAKLPPTGADLIVDIQIWQGSSWTSIFGGTQLVLPAGSADTDTGIQTTFAVTGPNIGDLLRADITQIGSGQPGQDISVMLRYT